MKQLGNLKMQIIGIIGVAVFSIVSAVATDMQMKEFEEITKDKKKK